MLAPLLFISTLRALAGEPVRLTEFNFEAVHFPPSTDALIDYATPKDQLTNRISLNSRAKFYNIITWENTFSAATNFTQFRTASWHFLTYYDIPATPFSVGIWHTSEHILDASYNRKFPTETGVVFKVDFLPKK